MKIQVGDYILRSDAFCMWIEKQHKVSKGENAGKTITTRMTGYCGNIPSLLSSFRRKRVMGSDAESMTELLKVLAETFNDMDRINRVAVDKDFKILKKMSRKKRSE